MRKTRRRPKPWNGQFPLPGIWFPSTGSPDEYRMLAPFWNTSRRINGRPMLRIDGRKPLAKVFENERFPGMEDPDD